MSGLGAPPPRPLSNAARRLAAIMFTDMVGYTALGQRNESLSLALVEEQRKVVRPILARHNGREVKTIGDAFLVEFPSAVDAVRCAYDIQRAVREFNLSLEPDTRIHLRVGVHVGEVVESQGDISGDAVNVASRIEPLAEDGGACVTRQVYDLVRNKVDIQLSSLGPKSLKNVSEPMEVYAMVMPWSREAPRAPSQLDRTRVAVLPFANMSPDANDEYFADGMTEELIDRLAQVKGLEVIARTSVMNYKKKEKNASQIGSELRAGVLVEGSVRKAGNKIRVTAQLIKTDTEGHLWSSHYDRSLDDIFAVQSEIAEKVAEELKVKLLDSEMEAIKKKPTEDTVAYTEYLQGIQLLSRLDEASLRDALGLFHRAVERDSSFARAFAGIANCFVWLASRGYIHPQEATEKGREAARRAMELDPDLAEAHYGLAMVMYLADDPEGSMGELKKAVELNPNLAEGYVLLAEESASFGHAEEMVRAAEKGYQLDPLSPGAIQWLGMAYFWTGREEEAMEHWTKTLHLEPYRTYRGMFDYHVCKGDYAKAEDAVKELERLGPTLSPTYLDRGYLAALRGDVKTANEMMAKLDISYAGFVCYALGDMDGYFEHMFRAAEDHALRAAEFRLSPLYERARADPRFGGVLKRGGLPYDSGQIASQR